MATALASAILASSSLFLMSAAAASNIEESLARNGEMSTKTKQIKCSMPGVDYLRVFSTGTNTIEFEWIPAWDRSNASYVVQWEITEGSGGCATPVCAPLGKVTTHGKYFTLDGMNPFTRVCLSVFPRTTVDGRNCDGPPSHLCARTLPQDFTIGITALNSTTFSITWKKQGSATNYSVHYCTRRGPCSQLDFGAKNATCREKQLPADIREFAVKKLKPWTSFLFKIVPYTTLGIDCFTTRVGVSSAPRDIRARRVHPSTVLVTWQPPAEPNGPISWYHIRVAEEGFTSRLIYDQDVSSTLFQMNNVAWHFAYLFQVQPVNYDYARETEVLGEPATVRLRFRN